MFFSFMTTDTCNYVVINMGYCVAKRLRDKEYYSEDSIYNYRSVHRTSVKLRFSVAKFTDF